MADRVYMPIQGHYDARHDIEDLRAAPVCFMCVQLPLAMFRPHEAQARINHGQTLERLAERGGLDPSEAVAILESRTQRRLSLTSAQTALAEYYALWQKNATVAAVY